jgi:outer membrane lipoprotein-sorting protein
MKKTIMLMLATALMGLCAQAQNAAKARQILDKTAAIVGNKNGASASFTIKGAKASTSGKISIKGNKFTATTPEATMWYDGKTQWTYVKDTEEVNISSPTEAQQAQMNPYKFITMYKSGYTLSMKTVAAGYEVHLVSQDKKRSIPEMYITVNSKTYLPSTVRLFNGKNWTTITISNFKASNLSDALFTFKPKDFPHAEVIDLR